jgi:putative FmdB family regulatory protein
MPIFEYRCRKCSRQFEEIVLGGRAPACPGCGGRDLEKLVSVFAVSRGGEGSDFGGAGDGETGGGEGWAGDPGSEEEGPEGAGPCGTCGDPRGPGSCAID